VPLSRTANFTKYTVGSFGDAAQRRLAEVYRELDRRGCKVLLSNSDHLMVRELYAGFAQDRVFAARNVNSDPTARGKIAELAVRNYDLPDASEHAGVSVENAAAHQQDS
jgi:DNA adenine methylase